MDIFSLAIASTLICQPVTDYGQVGFWESATTSRGGIGSNIEFNQDGSYSSSMAVLVDLAYDIKAGTLYTAKDKGKPVSYEHGNTIIVKPDGYQLVNDDGTINHRKRIEVSEQHSIVGYFSYTHYTGATAFERFTVDKVLHLRIPLNSNHGCYSLEQNKITLKPRNSTDTTKGDLIITNGTLELKRDNKSYRYNNVPEGAWYRSE